MNGHGWEVAAIVIGWVITLAGAAYKLGGIHNGVKTIMDNHLPHIQGALDKLTERFNDHVEGHK